MRYGKIIHWFILKKLLVYVESIMSKPASHTHIATSEHVDLLTYWWMNLCKCKMKTLLKWMTAKMILVEWQQEMDADDELNTDEPCVWLRFKPRRSAKAERLKLPSMALNVNRICAY